LGREVRVELSKLLDWNKQFGGRQLHDTRSTRRTNLFKRLFIQFSVFLLILGGMLPASPGQLHAAEPFTINGTDSYGIASDNTIAYIYQFDGNNPGTAPKASITLSTIVNNGLALSKSENVFYAANNTTLYRITPDGTVQLEATLLNHSSAATISEDGTKYYYATVIDSKYYLCTYNLVTKEQSSVEIVGYNVGGGVGGDIVVDNLGYMWFASQTAGSIVQMNPDTGEILREVPITNSDGVALQGGVRGLSFLPNGLMLLSSGLTTPTYFTLDPVTLTTTYIWEGTGPLVYDLASQISSVFDPIPPEIDSLKTVMIQEKAAGNTDGEHPEVGDTLLYRIQTRNQLENSAAIGLTISDKISEGLEYIPGTLTVDAASVTDAEGDDAGYYTGGQVVGEFGDVVDTDLHTLAFQVKILPGQAGKTIPNTALVTADNIKVPDEPSTSVDVYPRAPVLESGKTATIQEKAAGNSDSGHAEVGDTLLYTIQTRNTIKDSLVEKLVISDEVPAELEYVPGTLTVDGVSVTDAEGDDAGHYTGGQVVGEFGDIKDTNTHTVTFQAVVKPGQAGKNVINIASVDGDNVDTPDRPREEVEIYPRNPMIESEKSATNVDASKATYEIGDTVAYMIRTRAVVNDTYLENLTITDTLPEGLEFVSGSLKVDGVSVTDVQDSDAGYSVSGQVYGSFGNVGDMNWHTLQFHALILTEQGGKTIQNTALVDGDNFDPSEPTEKIVVEEETPVEPPVPPVTPPVDPQDPGDGGSGGGGGGSHDDDDDDSRPPVIESEKSAKDVNGGSIEVGDTIEYTIRARNTVSSSQVTNMVISDDLPEELEYVPGTLKVDGVSVTDSNDSDKGKYVDGTVTGSLGTVTDTDWHTLVFEAKVAKGEKGDKIKNVGTVDGDNLDDPDHPSEEITIDDRTPVLQSEKEAKDLNGGTIQVGDVIEYTIRTHNTIEDSVVTNLEISDALRAELQYVPGSLKVDGVAVTDAQDSDKGSYVNGTVRGQFGDVTDTAWHTVVFQAKLVAGQNGQTIRNTAEVAGDNLNDPDQPSEDIVVGGGSGSNPGVPGEPGNGSSSGNTNNPGWGGSDSGSTDSGQSGGSGGAGSTGQSGNSGDSVNGGNSGNGDGNGSKLPATATNMYGYLLVGGIILLAGLFLLRRKKA
jgi:fimbrial isopeptide formation D2 family protein/uncharacterized repeat protein (TIGR01451 family)/LPXTG-motif cell wall-anchored protein